MEAAVDSANLGQPLAPLFQLILHLCGAIFLCSSQLLPQNGEVQLPQSQQFGHSASLFLSLTPAGRQSVCFSLSRSLSVLLVSSAARTSVCVGTSPDLVL
ncbi:MAG TPA: hypothetical protein DCG12_02050 [Planctomycetaceae bacterium]|nr:hypothetical protein [Planctomycetaceae bacterium]